MKFNLSGNYTPMRILFLIWLFTLPVGGFFLPISLTYFTLYPNLILGIFLTIGCRPSLPFKINFKILILLYCFILLVYAICLSLCLFPLQDAKFDIRSLGMQLITALLLLGYAEKQSFNIALSDCIVGLKAGMYAILLFGCIEFLTGIHLYGHQTELLKTLSAGPLSYAPVFVFDNPNDYLMCMLFLFQVLLLIDLKFQHSQGQIVAIILILWMFSDAASCQFAKLNLGIIGLAFLIDRYRVWIVSFRLWLFSMVCFTIIFIVICMTHAIFIGPKFQNAKHYRLNSILLLEKHGTVWKVDSARSVLNSKEQISVENYLDSINTRGGHTSKHLRQQLISKGLGYIREHYILGLGPGGFKNAILQNPPITTGQHVSPHNFPIELISQFGILGSLYFVILLILWIKLFRVLKYSDWSKVYFFSLILSMPIIWSMSSAYLYQFTHWLLLPVCFVFYTCLKSHAAFSRN